MSIELTDKEIVIIAKINCGAIMSVLAHGQDFGWLDKYGQPIPSIEREICEYKLRELEMRVPWL